MYIRSVHIENIRSVEKFAMVFEEGHEAGWHVLIGENGSGKTTIARAVALSLLGYDEQLKVPLNPTAWLREGTQFAKVRTKISFEPTLDTIRKFENEEEDLKLPSFRKGLAKSLDSDTGTSLELTVGENEFFSQIAISRGETSAATLRRHRETVVFNPTFDPENDLIKVASGSIILKYAEMGWFSCAFGPFRRFSGGLSLENFSDGFPRLSAVMPVFSDDFCLAEIVKWLMDYNLRKLESKKEYGTIDQILQFLNEGSLLPNSAKISKISIDGILVKDASGSKVDLADISAGHRSALSLTFELIRQLIRTYGEEKVFANIQKGEMNIPLPGVVIIDEVDAHLHPTWQTKIGQWFTKYFPLLQFIVTTHSPLICRACGENGKIFKLAAPGSEKPSGEITDLNRDRLVYGDILEAYETDEFGDGVEWSDEGRMLQKEYRELVYRKRYGEPMDESESERLNHLKSIFNFRVEAE